MMYVLIKEQGSYPRELKIHGVVEDEATARLWKDWAGGDYVAAIAGDEILLDEPLKTARECEAEAKRRRVFDPKTAAVELVDKPTANAEPF